MGCMASVKIALVRGTGWMSRLIQWQTRSEYSHAALVVPDVGNGLLVVEAWQKSGVRVYRPTRREREEQMDFFSVEVTPQEQ